MFLEVLTKRYMGPVPVTGTLLCQLGWSISIWRQLLKSQRYKVACNASAHSESGSEHTERGREKASLSGRGEYLPTPIQTRLHDTTLSLPACISISMQHNNTKTLSSIKTFYGPVMAHSECYTVLKWLPGSIEIIFNRFKSKTNLSIHPSIHLACKPASRCLGHRRYWLSMK